ncbi:hypothetical protein HHI36_009528 [Cryptolaemus montrouzieri]|uniref:Uncharacterized protein n=1 Tax=Cryptolaemus montrouzieri TaxID=559131 RepID=A0ABD2MFZ6_9CUCU
MKFLFLFTICMNHFMIHNLGNARKTSFIKRDDCCCADAISRIASDLAAKAASAARTMECGHCNKLSQKVCMAKEEIADKSVEAARMAQSSLASKLDLVNKLTEEIEIVKCILRELLHSKKQMEEALNKEIEAIAQVETLSEVLDKALQKASIVAVTSDMVLSSVKNNIRTMDKILEMENKECHILCRKEHSARRDVELIKIAEKKAVFSATEAKKNALKIKKRKVEE